MSIVFRVPGLVLRIAVASLLVQLPLLAERASSEVGGRTVTHALGNVLCRFEAAVRDENWSDALSCRACDQFRHSATLTSSVTFKKILCALYVLSNLKIKFLFVFSFLYTIVVVVVVIIGVVACFLNVRM